MSRLLAIWLSRACGHSFDRPYLSYFDEMTIGPFFNEKDNPDFHFLEHRVKRSSACRPSKYTTSEYMYLIAMHALKDITDGLCKTPAITSCQTKWIWIKLKYTTCSCKEFKPECHHAHGSLHWYFTSLLVAAQNILNKTCSFFLVFLSVSRHSPSHEWPSE